VYILRNWLLHHGLLCSHLLLPCLPPLRCRAIIYMTFRCPLRKPVYQQKNSQERRYLLKKKKKKSNTYPYYIWSFFFRNIVYGARLRSEFYFDSCLLTSQPRTTILRFTELTAPTPTVCEYHQHLHAAGQPTRLWRSAKHRPAW
jgi:hypothetical protein